MKFLQCILPLFIFVSFGTSLRSTPDEIHEAISHLPQCSIQCLIPVVGPMNCNLSNITSFSDCFCANIPGQSQITTCMTKKCPFNELKVSEVSLTIICAGQPRPTRRPQLYAFTITSSLIVCVFVTLRCYSNYHISKTFWWDDGFLLISSAFFLCFQSVTLWGVSVGFGLHVWNSDPTHWEGLLRFEWSWELIYIVVQTMTKVSVLLLYYRIFPQQWFRQLIHVLIVFMFAHFLAFGIVIVNACHPIAKFWDKALPGKCINTRPVGVAGAIFSIVEDIVFLSLPIPLIWQLRLKTSRKIGIMVILTIGLVACVASIVRLKFLVKYNETTDQIWDNYLIVILSQIELCLSIVCVCFPAIRLLFSRMTDSGTIKSNGSPENSLGTENLKPSGFLTKICSIISRSSSHVPLSLPWVSSRAPQLSSIYITSHIELTEKNPSREYSEMEAHETHIAAAKIPRYSEVARTLSPDIVHVDKSGKLSPHRSFLSRTFQSSNQLYEDTSQLKLSQFDDEKIGTAR